MKLGWIVVVLLYVMAAAATEKTARTYDVRVVRDIPYLQGARYPDNKDKLDLYLPEGRRNAPVIVSYYGNQLMGGDKSEDAYIGRRFAAAGFVTAVVNYRLSPAVSHPAHGASITGTVVLLRTAPHRKPIAFGLMSGTYRERTPAG